MTTITLTPDIEGPLSEQARRQGTTSEQLALDTLRAHFVPVTEEPASGATLLDFLAGYIGTIDGTTEALSENCGAHFADGMGEKQRRGHL